jgi:hypothetical protein
MMQRAPSVSRRREHFCRSHCLRVIGLIRVGCRRIAAGSWQVPSESEEQGGLHCPVVGNECALDAGQMDGRPNLASSLVDPILFPLR